MNLRQNFSQKKHLSPFQKIAETVHYVQKVHAKETPGMDLLLNSQVNIYIYKQILSIKYCPYIYSQSQNLNLRSTSNIVLHWPAPLNVVSLSVTLCSS